MGATQQMTDAASQNGLKQVQKIKFVGAIITDRQSVDETNENFEQAFLKIRRVRDSWNFRYPSPAGASIVLKMLITSTLTHLLCNFDMTAEHVKEYYNIAKELLWHGSTPKVQKKRVTQPIARGGIGLTDIVAFSTSLRTRWYRQIIMKARPVEDQQDNTQLENWMVVLRHWLAQLHLQLSDIPKLGWLDMKTLGCRLEEMGCLYWGNTFRQYSQIVKTWEYKNDNITALPLFGGLCQHEANKHKSNWMSIFHPSGAYLAIFQRYKTLGDLFHARRTERRGRLDENRVDLDSPRNAADEFPVAPGDRPNQHLATIRRCFNNLVRAITKSVDKLAQIIKAAHGHKPIKLEDTALQFKCRQLTRGSSFAYQAMILEQAERKKIETAPAYYTWENDLGHGMTEREWHNSLRGVARVHVSPKARWLAIQIFYRQFYTPQKKYHSTDIIEDAVCPGCADHWPCNTRHIFYLCDGAAKTVWSFMNTMLTRALNKTVNISRNMALFHQHLTCDIMTATIMAAKHAIRRVTLKVKPPIHSRVVLAFLKTQILSTANTYIRAGKDTKTWTLVARETCWLYQEETATARRPIRANTT